MKLGSYIFKRNLIFLLVLSSSWFFHFSIQAEQITEKVSAATDSTLKKTAKDLNHYLETHKKTAIQNSDIAYEMKRALVIADLLFDSEGRLKTHLCKIIPTYFLSSIESNHEKQIRNVLDHLDKSWQPHLDKVNLPEEKENVSNLLLRALFSLKLEEPLTVRHAKVAILAGLLAPLNQGPVGDCFGIADLIREHSVYYQQSIYDYAEIIKKGYLTRLVDFQNDHFFYLPSIADDDIERTFLLDRNYKINGSDFSIFEVPGFIAAVNVMGGSSFGHELLKEVCNLYFEEVQEDQIEVTSDEVISLCGEILSKKQGDLNKDQLITNGKYAFSSLTNNPLLRAMESAFAALAEDRPHDYIRSNINYSVFKALEDAWMPFESSGDMFRDALYSNFNDSYRLIYNLNIPLGGVSQDGNSTDGGFQLYQRIPENSNDIGISIETPENLRELILKAVSTTSIQLDHLPSTEIIKNSVVDVVNGDDFLRNVLWTYDEENKKEEDPVSNYKTLSRTPMRSCDGDNPYEVNEIDEGLSSEDEIEYYKPINPKDLIQWCLEISNLAKDDLCPMNSPQHAFNFTPNNADIIAFKNSGLSSSKWIREMLLTPGRKIGTRKIDSNTRTIFSKNVLNMIQSILPDTEAYEKLVNNLSKHPLTIQQFAQKLLNGVNSLVGLEQDQESQLAANLDFALLQSLPENDLNTLQLSAIRFAFTNWNEGAKDLYFCAFYNLRTGTIGFGNIEEDKVNLMPMDEKEWVNYKQWDVDLNPQPPALLVI